MTGRPSLAAPSTPLRLTRTLILVFVASSLVSFAAAYLVNRSAIETAIEDQLRQAMAGYLAMADDDLVERIVADVSVSAPATQVLQYTPDVGPPISNVEAFPVVRGIAVVPEAAVRGEDLAESYLALSARVGPGELIIAYSRGQVVEMGEIMLTVFLIGLLPTLATASAIGILVARRASGRIETIRSVLHDLTGGRLDARVPVLAGHVEDLDQIGLAVNRMASAQEASVASLRQVSADIAHDLKTPIQRVAVLLDSLATRTVLSPEQDAIVGRALDESERIARTFDALLQIAQIEGGAVRERFDIVDLGDVAGAIVDVYQPAAEEGGHDLALELRSGGPFLVTGDRHLLGQVLANLIENGLRHVPAGGRIVTKLSHDAGQVVLSVGDDGQGIPAGERENVLRRLYRLERSRTTDGNGLGLSLVSAICDLHNGDLRLEDNAPGLLVSIRFPVTET